MRPRQARLVCTYYRQGRKILAQALRSSAVELVVLAVQTQALVLTEVFRQYRSYSHIILYIKLLLSTLSGLIRLWSVCLRLFSRSL